MMDRTMTCRDKACVSEFSRKQIKGDSSEILHQSNLILGSITNSMMSDTTMERLVSEISVKESAPSRITNGKAKAKMAHKKVTVSNLVAN